jgi:hypothetical protein
MDMDAKKLASHREVLKLIKNDLNLVSQNAVEVQDEDNK